MARVLVQSHLWIWWTEIAIDHEQIAKRARARMLGMTERADEFTQEFGREVRASLVAITAASHSLDALFGVVTKIVVPQGTGDNRWTEILEALKAGFHIRGPAGGGGVWARELKWLFETRGGAVHYGESMAETVPHPTGVNAGPEHLLYSLESAERAVSLLLEVLETCASNPRPPLAEWATTAHGTADDLSARRTAPPS